MAERAVVGVFSNEEEAVQAIHQLTEMGYRQDQISVLAKDPERFERLNDEEDVSAESTGDIAKGATTGAVTGGVIGGIGALIAELGVLAIPGVGPFLAAGPIAATVGGLLAGGAVGGVVGALVGLGVDKEEAKIYEENLENGDILVIVEADDNRYDRVYSTLRPGEYADTQRTGNAVVDQQNIMPGPYTDALQGNPEFNPSLDPAMDPNRDPDLDPALGDDRNARLEHDQGEDGGTTMFSSDNERTTADQRQDMNRDRAADSTAGGRVNPRDADEPRDFDQDTDLRRDPDDDSTFIDGDRTPDHSGKKRSLKDRLDRDGDGKLDFDDLRPSARDTDKDRDRDSGMLNKDDRNADGGLFSNDGRDYDHTDPAADDTIFNRNDSSLDEDEGLFRGRQHRDNDDNDGIFGGGRERERDDDEGLFGGGNRSDDDMFGGNSDTETIEDEDRSLRDRMDRDNDGRLDSDDLKPNPRDTDNDRR